MSYGYYYGAKIWDILLLNCKKPQTKGKTNKVIGLGKRSFDNTPPAQVVHSNLDCLKASNQEVRNPMGQS